MEGKEPIKVNLQTVLLILTLIVILIMAVAIGVLYNKNTKLANNELKHENISNVESETKVNNSIANSGISNSSSEDTNTNGNQTVQDTKTETTTNNNTSSKTGIKLVQFDTDFYKLEDVALEYRKCQNINNYKDFEYDLDGDGVKDKITINNYGKDTNGEIQYKLLLNGKEFFEYFDAPESGIVYIVDLNKDDKSIEIITYDDGPSDDPTYRLFIKQGSSMKQLSDNIGEYVNQKGIITSGEIYGHRAWTKPEVFEYYYKLENNTLKKYNLDISKIKDVSFSADAGLFTTDLKNIDKYWKNGNDFEKAGIHKLTSKDKFYILGFKNDIDIQIKLQDGREGYLLGNHFSD